MSEENTETKSGEPNIMDLFRLDGQVAVIVGGSRGLGASIALGFAQAGATTVICSRSEDDCQKTADHVSKETGSQSIAMALNVADESSVQAVFAKIKKQFGRIDILVNSAGINVRAPIDECDAKTFREVIDINLTGSWLCCREAVKVMKAQKAGSIINIGSALSSVALPERTPYCSSKFGIIGLTQSLALELASHSVRCNAICPGAFLTEMNKPLLQDPERVKAVVGQMALNRWGEMHEIRGAALFLASPASTFVTGASFYVDAGWTAK